MSNDIKFYYQYFSNILFLTIKTKQNINTVFGKTLRQVLKM